MTPKDKNSKIIIVGAGVYGLSTALSLLEDGFQDVHIFDKNDYLVQKYSYFNGCDSASSDMNKIFRASYGSQTHYQKMSLISRDKFLQWNKQIAEEKWEGGSPIYINSGNTHMSDLNELPLFERETLKRMGHDGSAIDINDPQAVEKATKKGLSARAVDPFDAKSKGIKLQGVLDTTGGIMIAEKCCRWVLELCRRVGGDRLHLHLGKLIGEVEHLLTTSGSGGEKKKCLGIKTKDGKCHFAPLTCIFAGAWLSQIVPEANEKVEATGGTVCICKVDSKGALEEYSEKTFPSWTYKMRDGAMGGLYGFPITHDGYMKIGYRGLKWINPKEGVNSKVKTAHTIDKETNVPLFGLLRIKNLIKKFIPEIQSITLTRLCWYSDTSDNDFLITYCPHYDDETLFVGAGDSGHAFMMLGSIGPVIKDIILKQGDDFLQNLFSWEREREQLNEINLGLADPRALSNLKMATPHDWSIYSKSHL